MESAASPIAAPDAATVNISHGGFSQELVAQSEAMRESEAMLFREQWGYDPRETVKHFRDPGFTMAKLKANIKGQQKLTEAITDSQMAGLLRYGVVNTASLRYDLVPTLYKSLAQMEVSRSDEEWYYPIQRNDIPVELQDTEPAPESRLTGFPTRVKNKEFGRILAFSKRLAEDDQTGQILRAAGRMGESMAYAEEMAWVVALFAFGTVANLYSTTNINGVPKSNLAGQTTAITTTAGALNQANMENAILAATFVTDLLGNYMLVHPDSIIISTADEITAKKLLLSMYAPSVPSTVAGTVGGIFSENVLKGMLQVFATPFITKARAGLAAGNPWAVMQRGEGVVFQSRTAMQLTQEDVNSGKSWEERSYRYQASRRFGVGVIESRFVFWGN